MKTPRDMYTRNTNIKHMPELSRNRFAVPAAAAAPVLASLLIPYDLCTAGVFVE